MYNLNKNNYHQKPKPSTIYTPPAVSQFIYELLKDKITKRGIILDPCCGMNSLLNPWNAKYSQRAKENNYQTYGIDINAYTPSNYTTNFLLMSPSQIQKGFTPTLILCNPPFNGYKNRLGSEVWLDKIIELFGKEVPIVLFTPIGFRLNLTLGSPRHKKLSEGTYPPITSQITLPKNIFEGVKFHSEILIFNIPGLENHYFYKPHE